MARLDIPHVPYTLVWNKEAPYSVCEDFVDENTELIPAWRVMMAQNKSNSTSVYQHFVNCCEALGVKDVVPFLDRMITLDYIIANEDRHFNNFGLIRNAETLEWIGMAPIYDSGSSLGYDKLPGQMKSEKDVGCKPFKNHHIEQLRLCNPSVGLICQSSMMSRTSSERYSRKIQMKPISMKTVSTLW